MEKDREMTESKNSRQVDARLISPEERLKHCYDIGRKFSFEPHTLITRYYRSGKELIRQADVYIKEGDVEKGFILYVRYMTMFLEKLNTHPQYNTIPMLDRENIKITLREILPKSELLKKKLLEQYKQEYARRKLEIEEQDRIEAQKLKQKQEQQRLREEEQKKQKIVAPIPKQPSIGIAAGAVTSEDFDFRIKRDVLPPTSFLTPQYDDIAQTSKDRKIPSIDRSTKPTSLTSSDRLRDIIVPSKLMQHFLKLADSNTVRNVETCGVLAGRLERNRLLVTHFLIPKQTGSPDSCVTHNEEDIFDYQDQHDLITLGWIHTHPTQTAFLSSVDLHTHCAYQLMMAEAIAIVCAPKYDETGFFNLTPDYGLNYIANCRESGFHPHPSDPPLFTIAKHFKLDHAAHVEAVDLRKTR